MCARAASPGGHNYDRENIPAILFVCTANQVRSPIAAAIFNQIQPVRFKAESAGTWTKSGLELAPFALRLAERIGVDLAGFRTTSIEDVDLSSYRQILVMECGHQEALTLEFPHLKDRICLLTAFAGLHPSDIPDPVKYDLPTAVGILTDMQDCVQRAAERLNSGNAILFAQNYY